MIDLENPELRGRLLRWAWLISLAMLLLGYGIIFCKVTDINITDITDRFYGACK